jgi:hypothetical protein
VIIRSLISQWSKLQIGILGEAADALLKNGLLEGLE